MTFDDAHQIELMLRNHICWDQEEIWVVVFDDQLELLGSRMLFRGTANHCLFHPRDLFKYLYLINGTRFILCHNHLSRNSLPSTQDLIVTKKLCAVAMLMEVEFVDHLILSRSSMSSLNQLGYMTQFKRNKNFTRQFSRVP